MTQIDLNHKKVLIIRPDNIGDLVCTTPLLHMLRQHYPSMQLDVLVNSYNAPVLQHQPDIDNFFYYIKGKHRDGKSLLSVYAHRFKTLWQLRMARYDYAVLAGVGLQHKSLRFARQLGIKNIIGFCPENHLKQSCFTHPVDYSANDGHEVEMVAKLLQPLGITDSPGPLRLQASPDAKASMERHIDQHMPSDDGFIGVHISSRKPENRWPEECYIELMQKLWDSYHQPFLLFWSPGDENNPFHPGDDQKAERIQKALPEVSVIPCPTQELSELIAGLSCCQSLICADGGAMHVGAAFVDFMVVVFGSTDAKQWRPWTANYQLLQAEEHHAGAVSVDDMYTAFRQLAD